MPPAPGKQSSASMIAERQDAGELLDQAGQARCPFVSAAAEQPHLAALLDDLQAVAVAIK